MSIKVSNISKSFKTYDRDPGLVGAFKSFFNRQYTNFNALTNINLNIEEGEILGILGENGAGKTTFIKLMVGLLHPTSGTIQIKDYIPWNRNPWRKPLMRLVLCAWTKQLLNSYFIIHM